MTLPAFKVVDDTPPSWLEAEQAVIGMALFDPVALEAAEGLRPDHFAEPLHGRIWQAIVEKTAAGRRADLSLIAGLFREDTALQEMGAGYLFDLLDRAPALTMAGESALRVREGHTLRLMRDLGAEIVQQAATGQGAEAIVAEAERRVAEIARDGPTVDRWMGMADVIHGAIAAARQRKGLIEFPVGLRDVDRRLGGLNAGEVTILAAWTGMGKSLAAQHVAMANASSGNGVCFFSLEMSENPMGIRFACDLAFDRSRPVYSGVTSNITMERIGRNELGEHEWERLSEAAEQVRRWPLMMDTRPGLSVSQIEAAARRQHRRWEKAGVKPGPVIVDHIGKVRPEGNRRGDKTAEMTDVSNGLADMAKRLGVPVVALCQLNRRIAEKGEDKRPGLEHLKQSGAIAEDARQVICLYRPEYYYRDPMEHETPEAKHERLEKLSEVKGHFYWLVEKNSHGPTFQALTFCEAACSAIRDWQP